MIIAFNARLARDYCRRFANGLPIEPQAADHQWSDEELFTLLGVITCNATNPSILGEEKWKAANDEQREAMAHHALRLFNQAMEHVWTCAWSDMMGQYEEISENRLIVSIEMQADGSFKKTVLQGEKKNHGTADNP